MGSTLVAIRFECGYRATTKTQIRNKLGANNLQRLNSEVASVRNIGLMSLVRGQLLFVIAVEVVHKQPQIKSIGHERRFKNLNLLYLVDSKVFSDLILDQKVGLESLQVPEVLMSKRLAFQ